MEILILFFIILFTFHRFVLFVSMSYLFSFDCTFFEGGKCPIHRMLTSTQECTLLIKKVDAYTCKSWLQRLMLLLGYDLRECCGVWKVSDACKDKKEKPETWRKMRNRGLEIEFERPVSPHWPARGTVVARGWVAGEMGRGWSRAQTSSCKTIKF